MLPRKEYVRSACQIVYVGSRIINTFWTFKYMISRNWFMAENNHGEQIMLGVHADDWFVLR